MCPCSAPHWPRLPSLEAQGTCVCDGQGVPLSSDHDPTTSHQPHWVSAGSQAQSAGKRPKELLPPFKRSFVPTHEYATVAHLLPRTSYTPAAEFYINHG